MLNTFAIVTNGREKYQYLSQRISIQKGISKTRSLLEFMNEFKWWGISHESLMLHRSRILMTSKKCVFVKGGWGWSPFPMWMVLLLGGAQTAFFKMFSPYTHTHNLITVIKLRITERGLSVYMNSIKWNSFNRCMSGPWWGKEYNPDWPAKHSVLGGINKNTRHYR